jgi:arabinan endo-1,5-alpha-L-arabinosidase
MVRLLDLVFGLGAALLPSLASAYALPEACSGVCVNSHDPSIIRRSDGTYFRFSTGGKIAVHTAPALTGPWTYKGAALPSGSSINLPGNQDLWVS